MVFFFGREQRAKKTKKLKENTRGQCSKKSKHCRAGKVTNVGVTYFLNDWAWNQVDHFITKKYDLNIFSESTHLFTPNSLILNFQRFH